MQILKYIPVLDGMRGLAVLAVLFFHLDILPGGYLGVDIFFVISGYLITKIIITEKNNNLFSFKSFYKKRFKRLFPALIFVSIFSLVIAIFIFDTDNLIRLNTSSFYSTIFLSNIFFWTESNYFDTSSDLKPLLHTWSLGIEMTFYIIFPIFLILIYKIKNLYLKLSILLFVILLSALSIIYLNTKKPIFDTLIFNNFFYGKYIEDTLFYLFPFRLFEFLFGSIIFLLPANKFKNLSVLLFNGSVFCLIFSFLFFNENSNYLLRTILTCCLTSILIYFRFAQHNFLLNNKFIIQIGIISYSLYLVHWPLIVFAKYLFFEELDFFKIILIIVLSYILSNFSYILIEKPLRKKYEFRKKIYLTTLILFYIILFQTINYSEGFKFRIDKNNLAKISTLNKDKSKEFCKARFSSNKSIKEKICLFGKEDDAKIVIMGDSNGTMWFSGFKELAYKNSFGIVSYSRACNNFPFLNANLKQEFTECKEVNLNNKILVIGAQWFNFQNENQYNFSENIAKFKENNNFKNLDKIIVMGQIPNYLRNIFDIKTCFSRPYYIKKINCVEYFNNSLNDNKYLEKIKLFNKNFNNQLKNNQDLTETDILFIDPVDILCEKNCIQFINEKLVYMDENHVSSAGSKYIIEKNSNLIESFINK